ncbi:hypothetical protein OEZ85_004524 [Tetradesmus obliquus]|uniref:Uncharacterized protein n=1 Tax=Tetradesmus obliquus TaxID=3088 RepID=A0ABY8UM43_TETOB|nr:hypothetical protein OEZ85_004524 [Tetradesmus obliquus]
MPWKGSPHGSSGSMPDLVDAKSDLSEGHVHECEDSFVDIPDQDRCLQCSLTLPAAGSSSSSSSAAGSAGVRMVAERCLHAGQLFMHPKSGTAAAEQVVWALPQQQLLDTLQSSPQGISIAAAAGAAAATAPSMQLLSPSFVLPCAAVGSGSSSSSPGKVAGAAQHVKTEWCLLLKQQQTQQGLHVAQLAQTSSYCCSTATKKQSCPSASALMAPPAQSPPLRARP